jgi:hypothetical protein
VLVKVIATVRLIKNSTQKIGKKFLEVNQMTKPWNWKPGKVYHPTVSDEEAEKRLKARAEWEKKWDACFGKKKLNNMEDNEKEQDD